MIAYMDASALVKRYVSEPGTDAVAALLADAEIVGTSLITHAETAAAFSKAVRTGVLSREGAASAFQVFRSEWPRLVRVQATELLIQRAGNLAWTMGLRGYDAVHLASALAWQEGVSERVTLATYDQQLWRAARERGLAVFPDGLVVA